MQINFIFAHLQIWVLLFTAALSLLGAFYIGSQTIGYVHRLNERNKPRSPDRCDFLVLHAAERLARNRGI